MVSLCSTKFNLSKLADKLRIVFETSKLKIVWWQFCFWKIGRFALKTIYYEQPVASVNLMERIMALQQMIDKEKSNVFTFLGDFVQ